MLYNTTTGKEIIAGQRETTDDEPLVSLSIEGLRIIQIVNHIVLSGTVCFLGIIVNIINIIIFVKQGVTDTVNLSLFAISVSDLFSLVTLEWLNINLNPFMDKADVSFVPSEIQYYTGGWPHACFARITLWITIYVTFERLCCIAFPLQIKQIVTPLKTKMVISTIYVLMLLSLVPEYFGMYYGGKFLPDKNQTRIGLIDRPYKPIVESASFLLYAVIGFVAFVVLILFTVLLVENLKRRTKWRKAATFDAEQSTTLSNRDRKTMMMVSLIAIILIICFAPSITLYVTVFTVPGFELTGRYANIFHATWSVAFLSEAVNSSVNIFLYYKMSTKYRRTFRQVFSMCTTRSLRQDLVPAISLADSAEHSGTTCSNKANNTLANVNNTNQAVYLPG